MSNLIRISQVNFAMDLEPFEMAAKRPPQGAWVGKFSLGLEENIDCTTNFIAVKNLEFV
jgi:hypothetical protein